MPDGVVQREHRVDDRLHESPPLGEPQPLRQRGAAQVAVDEEHARAAILPERPREIDRRRRLAVTGAGARHRDHRHAGRAATLLHGMAQHTVLIGLEGIGSDEAHQVLVYLVRHPRGPRGEESGQRPGPRALRVHGVVSRRVQRRRRLDGIDHGRDGHRVHGRDIDGLDRGRRRRQGLIGDGGIQRRAGRAIGGRDVVRANRPACCLLASEGALALGALEGSEKLAHRIHPHAD
jgi:hypothetical protein